MPIETPLYMQEGIYSARQDRLVFDVLFTEGIINLAGGEFLVSQRAAGANMSVDVAAGKAAIDGDDQANQGTYFVRSTTVTNVAIDPADLVNPRIDLVILQVRDANVIGGANNDATIRVVKGAPAGVPAAPALPASAIELARVAVAVGQVTVTGANITDRRTASSTRSFEVTSGWQRVTTAAKLALVPYEGQVVYDTDLHRLETYTGGAWTATVQPPETSMVNSLLHTVADQAVAIWELEGKALAQDNGLLDLHGEAFIPFNNRVASRTLDGAGFPVLGIYRDADRDQGFVALDDYSPLQSYKGQISDNVGGSLLDYYGMALSPDKKWLAGIVGGTIRIHPVNADGSVSSVWASQLSPASFSAVTGDNVKFTPDGKALVVLGTASPYVWAFAFNTATGVLGAKYADPATLLDKAGVHLAISPNSGRVAIAGGQAATPFFMVYAIDTTAGTWGAASAAPAAPPPANTYGVQFTDAGDYLIVSTATTLSAYAFNQATGVIGAKTDAPGVPSLTGMGGNIRQRGGKVIAWGTATPWVHGWTFAAGVWGAKWAAPATPPPSSLSGVWTITDDAGLVVTSGNGEATPTPDGWILNAASFGAKVLPANPPASWNAATVIPFPVENRGDVVFGSSTAAFALTLFGDKAGTTLLTGQLVTTTKVLPVAADQVYVLDDATLGAGVTRQYDVSLDGGATWTLNVPVGAYTAMTPGTQLKIRLTITRPALGVSGTIRWFAAWAG